MTRLIVSTTGHILNTRYSFYCTIRVKDFAYTNGFQRATIAPCAILVSSFPHRTFRPMNTVSHIADNLCHTVIPPSV